MYWRLTPSLTATIAAGRAMFLDVVRDRYFAAPPESSDALADWLLGGMPARSSATAHNFLVEAGGVDPREAAGTTPVRCELRMPSSFDAQPLPPARMGPVKLACLAVTVARARRDVAEKPLARILARRAAPSLFRSTRSACDRERRLAQFRTGRPLVPVPRSCLHDCLALLDWLGPARAGTCLVFGVVAYPFAAHSWIQHAGEVIDDHPESVSRFQPILSFQ